MYSGNMDNVKGTLVIFIGQMRKDVTMLKQKFIEKDYPSVKAFAHRMKPNLKLFGMDEMHLLVLDIEQAALESNAAALEAQAGNASVPISRSTPQQVARRIVPTFLGEPAASSNLSGFWDN
jgi:HPt (histidine-containing phosphotransfer) domain-containing protein